ncbi:copper resistance CopC/CopD family protein [Nocardioides sp. GXZ039]|uniref:copper resistance CopC/CopD family protein n=1 Tax=Nocardioides sp. GXZ039 TaxID=3136018 RepID=UPI0030F3EFBC
MYRIRLRAGPLARPLAIVVVLLAALAVVVGSAGPASAHATLVSTDPAEGAVLETAPEAINLTFDETVLGVPDGVQVFDAAGTPVESTSSVSGTALAVTLDQDVGEGTLVVVWRVVSEDGHPISGSLTFSVGAPSDVVEAPQGGAPASGTGAPWVLSLVRWLGYLGLLGAAGLVGFAVLLLPRDPQAEPARGRIVLAARVGAGLTAIAWLLALPLTAVYVLGGGAGLLGRSSTWSTLSTTEYLTTAAVILGTAAGVALLGGGTPSLLRGRLAVGAVLVAAIAPALVGHTRAETPEWLVVGADMVHLLAGSVWFGGLIALTLALVDLADRGTLGGELLARFSGLAAGILVALVVTGTFVAWRILGSVSALFDTAYGQMLLVKILAAVAVVLIAAWNRWKLLPQVEETARRKERRATARLLAKATGAEVAMLVVVLLITGFLVDKSPAVDAPLTPSGSEFAPREIKTASLGEREVRASMSPQTTGKNTLTIELVTASGVPVEGVEAPVVSLRSDDVDLGALPLTFQSTGSYTSEAVIPTSGAWTLQVSLRISEFENPIATIEFDVEDP